MTEIVAILVLAAAFGAAVLFHLVEAKAWRGERAQLLDRLMSRNWGEYVVGTRTTDAPAVPQLTTDQAEAAWYAAQERAALREAS